MTQPELGITPKEGYFHSSFFSKLISVCLEAQSHPKGTISRGFTKRKQEIKLSVGWLRRLDGGIGPAQPCPAQLSRTLLPHMEQEKQLLPGTQPAPAPLETPPSMSSGHTEGPLLLTQSLVFQLEWMVFSGAFNSVRCVCGCFNQQIDINRHLRMELFIRSWVPNFLRYF